jgi:hypothetical protein
MSKLKISDLSFCEVATEEDIEIQGGLQWANRLSDPQLLSILNQYFPDLSVDVTSQEVGSIPPGTTVEPIEDKANNASGFTITSQDGQTKARFLNGPGFSSIFASSRQTS